MKDKLATLSSDKLHFVVWKFGDKEPEINIEGHNLSYVELGSTHCGLQCGRLVDSLKYKSILKKCKEVSKLLKEIQKLNR